MNNIPVRDPDDRSSRVFPFDGDLSNAIYKMGVEDGVITGSIRYVLSVGNFFFRPAPPNWGGGENPGPLIPILQVIPESILFEDTPLYEESAWVDLNINNIGAAPLIISDLRTTAPWWVLADRFGQPVNLPITLAPGTGDQFQIKFVPQTVGQMPTGAVVIVTNSPTSPRLVPLNATGLEAVPVPKPPEVWTLIGGFLNWSYSSSMQIRLPAMQANDLALVCITWRDSGRWNLPTGWEVVYQQNDGMLEAGGRASMLIMYRVFIPGDPLIFNMSPFGGNATIPVANALCIGWRPKNGVPRFAGLSDQVVNGEFTFEAPSINVPNSNSLIHCMMGTGVFEDWFLGLKPFVATGLPALPSIPMSPGGSPPPDEFWRWNHTSHAATASPNHLSSDSYSLQPVPAGPTGKFVGEAVNRGIHRLVALVFDGPTG
jgi:hypothetical protein